MNKIGIVGALQIEIDLVLEKMNVLAEFKFAGFPFYTGTLHGKEIFLARSGVGKVNSAACTQILIDRFNIDCVINIGIAGSMKSEINICDMVLSTDVTHHDVRRAQMRNLYPFQETFIASEALIHLAKKGCEALAIKYHCGRVVSGECFVEDKKLKEIILKEYAPACVEMEGSSIGHVAYINQIPFIILRSISDNADEDALTSYEDFEARAAKQSASVVIEMISNI